MKDHDLIDRRSLALAKCIVRKIDEDPRKIGLNKAKKICIKWHKMHKKECFTEWLFILGKPWNEIKKIYLDTSENGKRLRQNSPFCGILENEERLKIFRKFLINEKKRP